MQLTCGGKVQGSRPLRDRRSGGGSVCSQPVPCIQPRVHAPRTRRRWETCVRAVSDTADAKLPRGHGVMPADSADSPFKELQMTDIWEGIGKTRVRQHVNPLSRENYKVTASPDWPALYRQTAAPLVLDLGCGPGRFLLLMHQRRRQGRLNLPSLGETQQPVNYLGLEIRRPLVERANEWSTRLGVSGEVHYIASNATISLQSTLHAYPGPIRLVAIQFPDPHFKRRHYKRRIFQPQMVRDVAGLMAPGGWLFLQSDVLEVAAAMRNIFEKYAGDAFTVSDVHKPDNSFHEEPPPRTADYESDTDTATTDEASYSESGSESDSAASDPTAAHHTDPSAHSSASDGGSEATTSDTSTRGRAAREEDDNYLTMESVWAQRGWLRDNPLGVPTEREHYVLQQGLPVYRILLVKKDA